MLTAAQRDMLIEHLDGVEVGIVRKHPVRTRIQFSLVQLKLLCFPDPSAKFPMATRITEAGRQRLAATLAAYADALLRVAKSDLLMHQTGPIPEPENSLESLQWLLARRSMTARELRRTRR